MASLDWDKVGMRQKWTSVTAVIRHNSKDSRQQTKKHSNPHINPDLTPNNINIDGLSCEERCERYKSRLAELDSMDGANRRKDRCTAILLETAVPKDLPSEQHVAWCTRVYDILTKHFGRDNMLYGDIHVDEIHDYMDARTGLPETSRVHMHVGVIPVDKQGKLNAKKAQTKANMIALNNKIEEMSQAEFHVKWMTGEKRKGADVDILKRESETAILQQRERNRKRTEELDARENDLQAREQALQADRAKLQWEREQAVQAHQRAVRELQQADSIKQAYESKTAHIDDYIDNVARQMLTDNIRAFANMSPTVQDQVLVATKSRLRQAGEILPYRDTPDKTNHHNKI